MYKIIKIIVAVISLLGIVSLVRIISMGDDAIDAAALSGDTAIIDPMALAAYIMLALILAFVIFFVLKNLFTHTDELKNTLIGVGAFAAVLIVAYLVSGGDPMTYELQEDNAFATAGQSQMVGAGLTAFYLLLFIAALSMMYSGVKKLISK